ncbi:MAG: hypothetical protein HYZ17_08275 [Betaproteobacteria bacterium]|nr:hypothetical protein [Betaproteobacteria bacterium]
MRIFGEVGPNFVANQGGRISIDFSAGLKEHGDEPKRQRVLARLTLGLTGVPEGDSSADDRFAFKVEIALVGVFSWAGDAVPFEEKKEGTLPAHFYDQLYPLVRAEVTAIAQHLRVGNFHLPWNVSFNQPAHSTRPTRKGAVRRAATPVGRAKAA